MASQTSRQWAESSALRGVLEGLSFAIAQRAAEENPISPVRLEEITNRIQRRDDAGNRFSSRGGLIWECSC